MAQRARRKKVAAGAIIGAALSASVIAAWWAGVFDAIEFPTWSWRVRTFATPSPATDKIKLIFLDQASLDWGAAEFGLKWPWERAAYVPIISFCKRGGAKVVAFDVLFTEPGLKDNDQALGDAIGDEPPFVAAAFLGQTTKQAVKWPPDVRDPPLAVEGLEAWLAGHPKAVFSHPGAAFPIKEITPKARMLGNVNAAPDDDGTYRRLELFQGFDGRVLPLLGVAAYLAGFPDPRAERIVYREGELAIGDRRIPIDSRGRAILNFRGPSGTHWAYPARTIIDSETTLEEGKVPAIDPGALKDCYVLFGVSAPGLMDIARTPVSRSQPGVEINATVLDNLLAGDFLRDAPLWAVIVATLLVGIGASTAQILCVSSRQSILVLAGFLPVPVLAGFALYPAGFWWPIVGPEIAVAAALVGGIVYNYATEGRQRRYIKSAFAHYLSPHVVEQIAGDPGQLKLGGERRELTIFFSDLEKFSTISERLDAADLTVLLNDYLSDMTDIILEEGGTLDKYEGDAIIAFWNAPLAQGDHAVRGVRAALRCHRKLAERREEFHARTGATLRMRVGMNTGIVVVGNMGSKQRFDYTMLGDAANLASRLEGANKPFRTFFMVAESTWSQTGGAFLGREIGELRVVGRTTPVRVFEPLGFAGEPPPAFLEPFNRGLSLVREGRWDEAAQAFASCGDDPVAAVYAERCRKQIEDPEQPWDGVWNLTEK